LTFSVSEFLVTDPVPTLVLILGAGTKIVEKF